eukprot:1238690-Pyramimonas_sp.AAC.1
MLRRGRGLAGRGGPRVAGPQANRDRSLLAAAVCRRSASARARKTRGRGMPQGARRQSQKTQSRSAPTGARRQPRQLLSWRLGQTPQQLPTR